MAGDRITEALRGPLPQADGDPAAAQQGEGSAQSGYAPPDAGPFECENCVHFSPPGSCDHPQVMSDPEVNGRVEPEGCCNHFTSAHNESQAQEHGEHEIEGQQE